MCDERIEFVCFRAIYFFAYANTKSFLLTKMERETPLVHVTSAATAGQTFISIEKDDFHRSLFSIFQESQCQHLRIQFGSSKHVYKSLESLLKTRSFSKSFFFSNQRAIDVIRKVYHENGLQGFYKGISASYVGVSETIVHFVIYEYVKVRLQSLQTDPKRSIDEPNLFDFLAYLAAGACSKSCATTLCYPHEVIRTRLREEGTKYRTFVQTFKTIYYEENFAGLYRGLLTHLIRQIPVSVDSFLLFGKRSNDRFCFRLEHGDYDEYLRTDCCFSSIKFNDLNIFSTSITSDQ